MENILKTKGLIKNFYEGERETKVLKSINLSINKGEFLSITGPSGSGKSTLIYQLGLLDYPTEGEVYLHNKITSNLESSERTNIRLNNFGFVFQDYALMPELSAWENVALPLLMRGLNISKAREKSEEILTNLGLGERISNRPNQLSGGESQRVSIARSVVGNPSILFADEPTANLDTKMSEQVLETFKKLNREGQTIIMVTHELNYANQAKRLINLVDGIITEDKSLSH